VRGPYSINTGLLTLAFNQIIAFLLVKHDYAVLTQFSASEVDCVSEHHSVYCIIAYFSIFNVILLCTGLLFYEVHVK